MNYLVVSIVVISIVVLILGLLLLFYQAVVIKNMTQEFDRMRRDLEKEFGFNRHDPACNISYINKSLTTIKKEVEQLYKLPLIKKSLKMEKLKELKHSKEIEEREIERLIRNGV